MISAMHPLFKGFIKNVIIIFKGRNLLWQLLAIILTIIIVANNFDWTYYQATRNAALLAFAFPAAVIGGSFPYLVPLGILAVGKALKKTRAVTTAWALGQAALMGTLISGTYKTFTGRIPRRFLAAS